MSASSHTSSWIYLEHLRFICLFIFNICIPSYGVRRKRDRDEGSDLYKKKKHVGVKEIKLVRDYGKGKGSDPDPVCPN